MFCIGIKNVIDLFQHMRGFPGGPSHQTVAMPMREHQRRKHMPVTSHQTVDILAIKTLTVQAVIKEFLIGIKVVRIGRVDHFQFAHRIAQTGLFELGFDILLTANHQRLAKARALIGHSRPQHARVIPLGKDHT